jgi:hypothetical protein
VTAASIGSALAVALIDPSAAEKIISVVGATGVCMVSYIIPVAIQIRGHQRKWRHPDDELATAAAARYYAWHRGDGGGGAAGGFEGGASSLLSSPLLGGGRGGGGLPPASAAGAADGDEDQGGIGGEEGWKGGGGGGRRWVGRCHAAWQGVVEPVIVLVIGVGFSIGALYVALETLVMR